MSYLDIKKKYGLATSEDEKEKKTSSGSSSYTDIAKKYGVSYDVDDDYLKSFLSDVNSFSSTDRSSWYSTWNKLDLGSRATTVRGWLNHNKKNYDEETYNSLSDMVDSYVRLNSHFSQFEDEDAYKKWNEENKKREEMLSYDSKAGEAYIKDLETNYNEAKKIVKAIEDRTKLIKQGYARGGYTNAKIDEAIANDKTIVALQEKLAQYGDFDALEKELNDKKLYHTLAGRAQNAAKLSSVSDPAAENYDVNFAQYSVVNDDYADASPLRH